MGPSDTWGTDTLLQPRGAVTAWRQTSQVTDKELQAILDRIAENTKYYRNLKGYSQEDMATLGFNYRHYQEIEAGKANLKVETVARIAHVFEIDISLLVAPVKKNWL